MLWSSRTNDGFPPLGLNCSDTLWSRHLQENIYSIHNHDIMIVTSNFSIIDHFSSDLLTNCTTGGSIPPWPVLSPSITETSKDHRVHKKQAGNNGKHDQDVVKKCHHCLSTLKVPRPSKKSDHDKATPSNDRTLHGLRCLNLLICNSQRLVFTSYVLS